MAIATENPICVTTDNGLQLSISIDRKTRDYLRYRKHHGVMHIFHSGEDVVDDYFNRHSRPYTQYRKEILPAVRKALNISDMVKFNWSQKAGCKCPCSPGFLVNDPEHIYTDFVICVDVEGIQKPDNREESLQHFNNTVWGFANTGEKEVSDD